MGASPRAPSSLGPHAGRHQRRHQFRAATAAFLHGGRSLAGGEAQPHRLWVVGAWVLGVVVAGPVALAAVVLGTAPAGAVVAASPTGAVVVGADAGGEVAEVPGARGARVADCPTTTPTEVLPPCGGWLPSRLASGRPAVGSTVVTAPIAIANTTAAASTTRCQRIG
jgi:hypothetical protein